LKRIDSPPRHRGGKSVLGRRARTMVRNRPGGTPTPALGVSPLDADRRDQGNHQSSAQGRDAKNGGPGGDQKFGEEEDEMNPPPGHRGRDRHAEGAGPLRPASTPLERLADDPAEPGRRRARRQEAAPAWSRPGSSSKSVATAGPAVAGKAWHAGPPGGSAPISSNSSPRFGGGGRTRRPRLGESDEADPAGGPTHLGATGARRRTKFQDRKPGVRPMAEYHRVIGIDLGTTFLGRRRVQLRQEGRGGSSRTAKNEPDHPIGRLHRPGRPGQRRQGREREKLAQRPEPGHFRGQAADGRADRRPRKSMGPRPRGSELDPEVVSAHILKELKAFAEKAIGGADP